MVDAGQQRAEELAVVDDAADRDAAEADAVIAALAADQAGARPCAADVVIGQRDLERRVGRLRARVAEEDVVEVARREIGDPRGRAGKPSGWAKLEGRREVELARLPLDRLDDRLAVMAGVAAPQRRRRVEDLAPSGV